jgi:integrase
MWIEKLSSGKYRAVERYTDPMTGKERKASVTIDKDTRATRKAAAEALRAKIESATAVVTKETVTLKELVEAYRKDQEKTVRPSTYTRNYFACNSLMEILGEDTLVNRLSAPYVREKLLAKKEDPGTMNERLRRYKALIRWGFRNDLVDSVDYLKKLPNFKDIPHRESIKDKYMEAEELKALLDHMSNPVWKLLTEFLSLSGLRIGEAIALEQKDIDTKALQIHVTKAYDSVNKQISTAKTMCSVRDVAIQPQLLDCCKRISAAMRRRSMYYGLGRRKLFLYGIDGEHIEYYAYNKYLRENTEKVIGRQLTPHALRHTHASLLMEAGVPIDVISRRLGHESSKVTREIYLHVTQKLKQKDDELIGKVNIL